MNVKRILLCKFYPYMNTLSMRNNNILILDFLKLISRTNSSYSYVNNSHINNHLYVKRIPSYKFYPYANPLSTHSLCFLVDVPFWNRSINLKS